MAESPYKDLWQFHKAFECPTSLTPKLPDEETRQLRLDLLEEEWEEYLKAEEENDLVEIADALADIIYIAYGTAVAYGLPMDRVFNEVHSSNMSKLGADGRPLRRADGKVMKGPNFRPPDIETILETTTNARDGEFQSAQLTLPFD